MNPMTSPRSLSSLVVSVMICLSACGARTPLEETDGTGGGGTTSSTVATTGATMERSCGPNCTVGHQCCVGGCSGPAAKTLNDCCVCFSNEVNSMICPGSKCGQ